MTGAGPRERDRPLLSLVPYLRRHRTALVVGAVMVLATNAAAVVAPWILRSAVDHLHREINRDLVLFYASLLLAAALVEGVFRFLMRHVLIGTSRRIEYDLRNDLFRHLQRLEPGFYQRNPTGDLMARSTNDLNAVRMVLGPGIMYSMNTLFTSVMVVSILVGIEMSLAVLTLIPLLAVSLCVKFFGRRIHQRFELIQQQFSAITSLAQETISGIRVVKAYNQEAALEDRFRQANRAYIERSLSLVKIWGVFSPLLTLLLGLSLAGLLWYGGRQVVAGAITLGEFVAFIAYLGMLTWPTIALGWVINVFERGSASMGRINTIMNTEPRISDAQAEAAGEIGGEIEIRNLNFAYNGVPVLSDLNLRIPAGRTVAIVGATGSGKSTLVNLLCRLYPVPAGTIFLDGRDINRIPLRTLRGRIGCVPQDTFLFSETVSGNIAFGVPEAGRQEIEEASRISNIWPDIQRFPRRFDTFVGERGITLSGGQKQRIAISRALLVDPKILILDDALSSVDTETEERILTRLAGELSDRTALLISHRISTVRMADEILVLDNGRIVERGGHEDLLRAGGYYADLHRKQQLKEELGLEQDSR